MRVIRRDGFFMDHTKYLEYTDDGWIAVSWTGRIHKMTAPELIYKHLQDGHYIPMPKDFNYEAYAIDYCNYLWRRLHPEF